MIPRKVSLDRALVEGRVHLLGGALPDERRPRGKLICVSTPYRQVGVLYEAFRGFYGKPTSVESAGAGSQIWFENCTIFTAQADAYQWCTGSGGNSGILPSGVRQRFDGSGGALREGPRA